MKDNLSNFDMASVNDTNRSSEKLCHVCLCACAVCRSCIVRHLSDGNRSCPRCGSRDEDDDYLPHKKLRIRQVKAPDVTRTVWKTDVECHHHHHHHHQSTRLK